MAKALALDLAPRGITVNVVAPGWFDSPLADGFKRNPALTEEIPATLRSAAGDAADLAGAYLFLASDAAAFVTGTVITVDGGYLLGMRQHRHRRRTPAAVVVITGAGGALGPPLSRQFAGESGTDVVLSDLSEARLGRTSQGSPPSAGAVETLLADVSDPARSRPSSGRRSSVRAPRRAREQCRGALPQRPHPQPHHRRLERAFRVNVLGAVNGIRAAVAPMRAKGRDRSSSPRRWRG